MNPFLILIGLIASANFAILITMRGAGIKTLTLKTALLALIVVPVFVFLILNLANRI